MQSGVPGSPARGSRRVPSQLPPLRTAHALTRQAGPRAFPRRRLRPRRRGEVPVLRARPAQVEPAPPQLLAEFLAALAADAPLVRPQPARLPVYQIADAVAGPSV